MFVLSGAAPLLAYVQKMVGESPPQLAFTLNSKVLAEKQAKPEMQENRDAIIHSLIFGEQDSFSPVVILTCLLYPHGHAKISSISSPKDG